MENNIDVKQCNNDAHESQWKTATATNLNTSFSWYSLHSTP